MKTNGPIKDAPSLLKRLETEIIAGLIMLIPGVIGAAVAKKFWGDSWMVLLSGGIAAYPVVFLCLVGLFGGIANLLELIFEKLAWAFFPGIVIFAIWYLLH